MKLPRDLSGAKLAKALERMDYRITRQTGSHIRLTCHKPSRHHITIPNHDPLKVGTLAGIPGDVAFHHRITREELSRRLFEKNDWRGVIEAIDQS
jgi:predicted RNA binding protein YcfA (HicA-like mRNA interferase family)